MTAPAPWNEKKDRNFGGYDVARVMATVSVALNCAGDHGRCPFPVYEKGLCNSHYARTRRPGGRIDTPIRAAKKTLAKVGTQRCAIPGCVRPYYTAEHCRAHYDRKWRLEAGLTKTPMDAPIRTELRHNKIKVARFGAIKLSRDTVAFLNEMYEPRRGKLSKPAFIETLLRALREDELMMRRVQHTLDRYGI